MRGVIARIAISQITSNRAITGVVVADDERIAVSVYGFIRKFRKKSLEREPTSHPTLPVTLLFGLSSRKLVVEATKVEQHSLRCRRPNSPMHKQILMRFRDCLNCENDMRPDCSLTSQATRPHKDSVSTVPDLGRDTSPAQREQFLD